MSDSNVVVITGANRGIGLELARHYAAEGCEVIGVCRQSSDELASVAAQVIDGVDVTTDAGIDKLKSGLAGKRISLLINNAGLLQDEQLGSIDFDSIRTQMEINAYAPLRVAEALAPLMGQGSKIANITSRMGSIADNDSGGRYGYRASKAAHNQVLVALTNYCRRVAASTERSGARSPNMFVLDVRNGLSTRALRETGTPASCCFVASRHSGTIRCLRETGLPTANTEHARAQDVLARDDAWGSVVFTSVYFDACGLS